MTATEVNSGGTHADVTGALARLWQEVLGGEAPARQADFFACGGDSLTAVSLLRALNERFGTALRLVDVFDNPVLGDLAALVASSPRAMGTESSAPASESYPVAFSQKSMYAVERAIPGMPFFTTVVRVDISGRLDIAALSLALSDVARRQHALRTHFIGGEDDGWQIVDDAVNLRLDERDVSDLPLGEREAAVVRTAEALLQTAHDIATPPWRVTVVHCGAGRTVLLLSANHIIFDGWSRDVFFNDLVRAYGSRVANGEDGLRPLEISYGDFARWQRLHFSRPEVIEPYLAYWRRLFDQAAPAQPVAAGDAAVDGDNFLFHSIRRHLDATAWSRVVAASAERAATPFVLLTAAYAWALREDSGSDRLVLCALVANRDAPGTAEMVGMFANTVGLLVDCREARGVEDLVAPARTASQEAHRYSDLPLERVLELHSDEAAVEGRAALRLGIALQTGWPSPRQAAQATFVCRETGARAETEVNPSTFDVTLEVRVGPTGAVVTLQHRAAAMEASRAERLCDRVVQTLVALAEVAA